MKRDEDFGPYRDDDFQTDDEENQARRVYDDDDGDTNEYDTDSDLSSRNASVGMDDVNSQLHAWPQSFRFHIFLQFLDIHVTQSFIVSVISTNWL